MSVTRRAGIRWTHALRLVAFAVLAAFLVVELSLRCRMHLPFFWGEADTADPVVGNIPRANFSYCNPIQAFCLSMGDYGTRRNGDTPPHAERPLTLAVGDSFTFGDDVGDADSWPAALERLTGRRVINAGVPAFGLDQTVLRAEQLAPIYSPQTIIVSFVPDDVRRTEMSYFSGRAKPYFELEGTKLHLHAAPVPPRSALAPLKWLLSASLTMNELFDRFLHWEGPEAEVVDHHGREIACLLMERLAALGRDRGARVVVLGQPQAPKAPPEHAEIKNAVLACAAASGLRVLDLFPGIEQLPDEVRQRLFRGHMTAAGNQLVAAELARFMGSLDH